MRAVHLLVLGLVGLTWPIQFALADADADADADAEREALVYRELSAAHCLATRLPGCCAGIVERQRIHCELRDERYSGESLEVTFAGNLRPDQQAAIAEMLGHDVGVLCAPTAFGKTVAAAAMIATRGVNTLVLVYRTELLKQWQERLRAFLCLDKGAIGTIGGGKTRPTGKIDIAVMQSLSRQGKVNPLVENYGHVIVDDNFAGSETGRTSVRPQGARHGRRASMPPCRCGVIRRHSGAHQGEIRARPHRHADPSRRPATDHLYAWMHSTGSTQNGWLDVMRCHRLD